MSAHDKGIHVWLPRWIAVAAWAVAIFVILLPLCVDTFWIRWDLPALGVLAWVLALVSFILRRTLFAGSLVVGGVILAWCWF